MSLLGVHVGFAALVTTLLLAPTGLARRWRWLLVVLAGVWAVVPDLYHLVPGTRAWYKPLVHDSAWSNVFWLHGVIDQLDPRDRVVYSVAAMVIFLVVATVVERWIAAE